MPFFPLENIPTTLQNAQNFCSWKGECRPHSWTWTWTRATSLTGCTYILWRSHNESNAYSARSDLSHASRYSQKCRRTAESTFWRTWSPPQPTMFCPNLSQMYFCSLNFEKTVVDLNFELMRTKFIWLASVKTWLFYVLQAFLFRHNFLKEIFFYSGSNVIFWP